MDAGLAPMAGIHVRSALLESILDSLRECLRWLGQEQPSPWRKPPWRQLRSIVPEPDRFDTGSPDNSSRVRHRTSLAPRLRTAPAERGFGPRPRTPPTPVAWRRKLRRLRGAPDPRIAGAAADSAGPEVRHEQHLPARRDSATAATTGDQCCSLGNCS